MKMTFLTNRASLLAVILTITSGLSAAPNPVKVEGPESCAECHVEAVDAWKLTHHFSTFNEMHRTPEAREIAQKLGIKRIKHESLCLSCHYTSKEVDGEIDIIAGISCESCHGAAADWVDIHNDYGVHETKENEPADHKQMRIEASIENGMIHPTDIYAVASNCYECHLVPNENLVNVGGHPAGSENFELVSWLNGEVRHNFQASEGKVNAESTIEHKRMLFILSIILETEHGLRGTAKATSAQTYGRSMAARTNTAIKKLAQVAKVLNSQELAAIHAAATSGKLTLNNAAELTAAADKVAELGKAFAETHDGSDFGALDKFIESAKLKGDVYQPSN